MKFVDPQHPFYRPLWRRVAIVAAAGGWTAVEVLLAHDGFWGVIFGAIFAYSLWTFIITWKDQPPEI